jgi:uncharacterized protein (TIGR02231 family)
MQLKPLLLASVVLIPTLPLAAPLPAVAAATQDSEPLAPTLSRVDLPIRSVAVYRSRAAVTRASTCTLAQGVHELRIGPLPEFADLESVQAKIGAGGKLLDVKTETIALAAPSSDNPRVREALESVEAARDELTEVERRLANNAVATKLVDSIAAKTAGDASQAIGSALDPEKLRAQIAFIEAERNRLTTEERELTKMRTKTAGELAAREKALAAAGGAPPAERYVLVTVAAAQGGSIPVEVTYLVGNATWSPAYTVRGDPAAGTLAIEFDAVVRQATGEDWSDVSLVLSTAQPTRAANPREIAPMYVDAFDPSSPAPVAAPSSAVAPSSRGALGQAAPTEAGEAGTTAFNAKNAARIDSLSRDAEVGGGGAAVEYRLPRSFSAPSNASGERRTRVANIDAKPVYALVARPLVESDVFLRARMTNESGYILLPGRARVYLGSDSIGTAAVGEIPVGGELELWFGKEPGVTVKRELVAKKASESGLFAKSKGIDREYRISLTNTLPRAIEVELWDRIPVSRSQQVVVDVRDVAPALSTDARYLKDERKQGLLKWTLALPARTAGTEAVAATVAWKTRTTWPDGSVLSGDAD